MGHAGNVEVGGGVVFGDEVALIAGVEKVKQFPIPQQDEALAHVGGSHGAFGTIGESGGDQAAVGAEDGIHDRSAEGSGLHRIAFREEPIQVRDGSSVFQRGDEGV